MSRQRTPVTCNAGLAEDVSSSLCNRRSLVRARSSRRRHVVASAARSDGPPALHVVNLHGQVALEGGVDTGDVSRREEIEQQPADDRDTESRVGPRTSASTPMAANVAASGSSQLLMMSSRRGTV